MTRPLDGIKVLDLTRLLPGPFCTMFLADFGAEVIKIEEPNQGDYARWYPPLVKNQGYRHLLLNRNKSSLALNLKEEEGRQVFSQLAQDADVIIESFRPGVAERLGIDYESIKKINGGIVYCSLTGYGQDGPYRTKAGHDINYIAYGGVLGLTGPRDGLPCPPGIQVADLAGGGLMALVGILLALQARHQTGRGQFVDISMLDGVLSLLPSAASFLFGTGEVPERGKTRLTGALPWYRSYETRDGKYVALGALEEKFWRNFCTVMEREDLIPKLQTQGQEREELHHLLQEIFLARTRKEWLEVLEEADACLAPVNNLEEAFADPQVGHRQMVLEMEHPLAGGIKQLGIPIKLSETPGQVRRHAPALGEQTAVILSELGYSQEEIKALAEKGVVRIQD